MSCIWTIMSTTKVSYFVALMCYVDSEAYTFQLVDIRYLAYEYNFLYENTY